MRAALVVLLVAFPLGLVLWIAQRAWTAPAVDPALSLGLHAGVHDAAGREPGAGTPEPGPAAAEARDEVADALRALLASPLAGFAVDGELQLYDDKGLFDYIDGAAPTFIERGFKKLAAVELKSSDGGEATCDVYDMGAPPSAAAIYGKEKPATANWATVGDEGHRGSRSLVFRRTRYYVKLTAFDDAAEGLLGDLATLLVRRMDEAARQPTPDAAQETGTVLEAPERGRIDDADALLRGMLRAPLDPARLDGEVVLYDDKGLFDYIDGAAPVYLERGFRMLAAAELRVGDAGELTCDVYDMASADNARAIYDKERPATAVDAQLGDRGHRGSRSLVLTSGPYYIKLTAFDDAAEAALPDLAKLLVQRIR
ncbi:MAG: DUF6599 family protein [Pseudomonadota bacterium]